MKRQQAARFASVCRLFVPMYRQATVTAMKGEVPRGNYQMTDDDVKGAWTYYVTHKNDGHGVVLIGHSQGAIILPYLVKNEIAGKPAQKLIVPVILAGGDLQVPKGKDIGGDFRSMPPCPKRVTARDKRRVHPGYPLTCGSVQVEHLNVPVPTPFN